MFWPALVSNDKDFITAKFLFVCIDTAKLQVYFNIPNVFNDYFKITSIFFISSAVRCLLFLLFSLLHSFAIADFISRSGYSLLATNFWVYFPSFSSCILLLIPIVYVYTNIHFIYYIIELYLPL